MVRPAHNVLTPEQAKNDVDAPLEFNPTKKEQKNFEKLRSRQLSWKEMKFCEHYLENGGDGMNAVVQAGYGYSTRMTQSQGAWQILRRPIIQEYLKNRVKRTMDELSVTFDYKVKKLKKLIDVCVPDDASSKDHINAPGAIGAISELNKMQGDYAPDKSFRATIDLTQDDDIVKAKLLLEHIVKEKEQNKEF